MDIYDWIYQRDGDCRLGVTQSPDEASTTIAVIEITRPTSGCEPDNENRLEIPENVFDEMAIAWCKNRKLHGALGGPVGNEWGSPDSDWE